jgi:hypothetical protein
MNLDDQNLVEWLSHQPKEHFPFRGKVDYFNQYLRIKEFLDNEVHPHITSMTVKFEEEMYLTKHGTEHIDVVIDRISKLINTADFIISGYEAYILLVAAQLHDTGHIKSGRESHEKLSNQIIEDLASRMGNETIEKSLIWKIAEAHGGRKANGKKDKIDDLLARDVVLFYEVHPQMLAAILRFADELADDYTRSSPYLLQSGGINKGSEIFHYYASVLHSIEIDHIGKQIKIFFTLNTEHLVNKYGKSIKDEIEEVYLVDEIFERIYKMYMECLYCMRFVPYSIKIETIIARIDFIDKRSLQEFRSPISIKLSERGYPRIAEKDLYQLCGQDLIENGQAITGEYLKNSITP